jgi:integrase
VLVHRVSDHPAAGRLTPKAAQPVPAAERRHGRRSPAHYRALVILLAGTGLRPAEGLGLCTSRVDWLRRQIRVDQQLVTIADAEPTLAPPKTPTSVRTIPVPAAVLDALALHVEQFGVEGDALVFHDETGTRSGAAPSGTQRRAVTAENARGEVRIVDRTPHDLRHYAASVLIDRGASVKSVQRHLGHASAKTTLDTYAHFWPEAEDATRAALHAGLQGVVNDAPAVLGVAR